MQSSLTLPQYGLFLEATPSTVIRTFQLTEG